MRKKKGKQKVLSTLRVGAGASSKIKGSVWPPEVLGEASSTRKELVFFEDWRWSPTP